ncbi:MAG: TIGR03617 family F420-dependent LLM class oxidoreductase [Actinomycetota bacterium]
MEIGLSVGGPLGIIGDVARRCEEAGYPTLWVAETSRTAFLQSAVALQATTTTTVGTAIALAFPRSPVVTAMEARDLAELSGGRFILGLGTQVKRVNEHRYATPFEHPAPKMREVIEVCRKVWRAFAGEPIDHRGRFYTVTMPPFPGGQPAPGPIPIYLAAVNKGMVQLTGEVGDGILGHPFSSPRYFTESIRPALDAGLERAGRKQDEVRVVQGVICSIGDSTEEAMREAKMQIAFYGTTRTYSPVFVAHGWEDVVGPLRDAFAKGDIDGMIGLISDEMCETYAIAGTPDEVREKIRRWEGLADALYLGPPWAIPDQTRTAETFARIVDTFGPA